MKAETEDPDTLQILDEQDAKWVSLWKKAAFKQLAQTNYLSITISPQEETIPTSRT